MLFYNADFGLLGLVSRLRIGGLNVCILSVGAMRSPLALGGDGPAELGHRHSHNAFSYVMFRTVSINV